MRSRERAEPQPSDRPRPDRRPPSPGVVRSSVSTSGWTTHHRHRRSHCRGIASKCVPNEVPDDRRAFPAPLSKHDADLEFDVTDAAEHHVVQLEAIHRRRHEEDSEPSRHHADDRADLEQRLAEPRLEARSAAAETTISLRRSRGTARSCVAVNRPSKPEGRLTCRMITTVPSARFNRWLSRPDRRSVMVYSAQVAAAAAVLSNAAWGTPLSTSTLVSRTFRTVRHATHYLECGPADGSLMIFLHGWPEFSLIWRAQMDAFAADGWRCVAPDLRGYGGSSAPAANDAYTIEQVVTDMAELHDHLGGTPAI